MTKEIVYCDRCGQEIIYPISVQCRLYKGKHLKLTDHDKRIDLCQSCSNDLKDWLHKVDLQKNNEVDVNDLQ